MKRRRSIDPATTGGTGAAFQTIYPPERNAVAAFDALIERLKGVAGKDQLAPLVRPDRGDGSGGTSGASA